MFSTNKPIHSSHNKPRKLIIKKEKVAITFPMFLLTLWDSQSSNNPLATGISSQFTCQPKVSLFYTYIHFSLFLVLLLESIFSPRFQEKVDKIIKMKDYAAVLIATALFAFLCPGLLFQLPGKHSPVDFLNMKTSIPSMVLHTVLYGLLLTLFLIILDIHIYA